MIRKGAASERDASENCESLTLSAASHDVLLLLLRALEYARDAEQDPWNFAVEIGSFYEAGLANSDLRWLVCKELVEHGLETTDREDLTRSFHVLRQLSFGQRSCFVLTPQGEQLAYLLRDDPSDSNSNGLPAVYSEVVPSKLPKWDDDRRELRYSGRLIKRYRVPSPNQQAVLCAFQEEGWPARVDDPLPPHPEMDPKRRLQQTIKSLNRCRRNQLVRFTGDGTGEGVCWEGE